MMRHRVNFVIAGVVLTAALFGAGCQTASKEPAKTNAKAPLRQKYTVNIKEFAFSPAHLTVAVDSRVTWINKDPSPHSIVSKTFDSGMIGQEDTYSYQFLKAGTYAYHCSIHPYMEGVIVVK